MRSTRALCRFSPSSCSLDLPAPVRRCKDVRGRGWGFYKPQRGNRANGTKKGRSGFKLPGNSIRATRRRTATALEWRQTLFPCAHRGRVCCGVEIVPRAVVPRWPPATDAAAHPAPAHPSPPPTQRVTSASHTTNHARPSEQCHFHTLVHAAGPRGLVCCVVPCWRRRVVRGSSPSRPWPCPAPPPPHAAPRSYAPAATAHEGHKPSVLS